MFTTTHPYAFTFISNATLTVGSLSLSPVTQSAHAILRPFAHRHLHSKSLYTIETFITRHITDTTPLPTSRLANDRPTKTRTRRASEYGTSS